MDTKHTMNKQGGDAIREQVKRHLAYLEEKCVQRERRLAEIENENRDKINQ
ncbi:MAG: hypothetical protein HUK22_06020 [Thermoguttaceae bacterium]|nr:hypothetical protein [Thermoguttaceae bacterium]